MRRYYKAGAYNVICDVCGFEFKSDELQKRWDGVMVCKKDYEVRHPQDLIRVPREDSAIPWARPEPEDTFIAVSYPISDETGDELSDWLLTESGQPIYTEG